MTGEEREHMASRRRFGEWANAPETIPLSSCGNVFETEVLVVGAGIAGMTCAFSAAECGAKVTGRSSALIRHAASISELNSSL